ncbi:uncharacterized protein LOC129574665 [Sitodiplosis mosellana]|uniref:uncharacterized protein LOC129574665 n=1 Tax=Sitodiplosis mosellana TaxID=263140 RepID=UPI002444C557|nr:uncharacterized protein LOC129574665 [Sitodiplosis mosellana]
MIRLWLAVGSPFNNRDIPNILVIVITFMLFLLHTMMNTANHLMLICFKASPEKFKNIGKHTDSIISILMSTCIVMIIFDFFIPIWQLDMFEYITLHSLIFISGFWNHMHLTALPQQCAIRKGIEMFANADKWVLSYCFAWGLAPIHRDMIVAMFSEPMWNLDYTKFKKLEKDGKIRRLYRDGEDVLLYFCFNFCVAIFLGVRDYYVVQIQIPLNPATASAVEPIVKETTVNRLPDEQTNYQSPIV